MTKSPRFLFAAGLSLALTVTGFAAPQTVTQPTYGLNFGPYLNGADPNLSAQVTSPEIQNLLAIIAPYTKWIRPYGSTHGLENVPFLAKQLNLKVAATAAVGSLPPGITLGSANDPNMAEINSLIANANSGDVDIAIVGTEVIRQNLLTVPQLIQYMQLVRAAIPPTVKVATSDIYPIFLNNPGLITASDVVLANFYPYWEGTSISYALCSLQGEFQHLQSVSGSTPVAISETGWPGGGSSVGSAVPSPANASLYANQFLSWANANSIQSFYFEAFDESFKTKYEGPQGGTFGIWDSSGFIKPGMSTFFNGQNTSVNCVLPGSPGLSATYVPPYSVPPGNGTTTSSNDWLEVQATGVNPANYVVAGYIKVNNVWYTKPTYPNPTVQLNSDGSAAINISTGGSGDYLATDLAAFLIPSGTTPPQADGTSGTLPSIPTAVGSVQVSRTASSISGRITDLQGNSISGATISGPNGATTSSAPDGRYSFYNISTTGQTQMTASYPNYAFPASPVTVTILSGNLQQNFTGSSVDLSLSASLAPALVLPGSTVVETFAVGNAGVGTATSATLTASIPSGLTFASATSTKGTCASTATEVTCNIGALANSASVSVVATLTASFPGTFSLTAFVSGPDPDLSIHNKTTSLNLTVLAPQTITFGPISTHTLGASTFPLSATVSSNLALTYASNTTSVCTVSGSVLIMISAGTCSLTASRAGNAVYSAADPVTQTLTVLPTPAVTSVTPNTIPRLSSALAITIAGSDFASGATVSFTLPGGIAQTITPNQIQAAQITANIPAAYLATAGTAQVAVSSGGALSNQIPFSITATPQTITFNTIPNQILGISPFSIVVRASSGLSITIASTTASVCRVRESLITLVGAGTCSLTANQYGGSGFAAATPVIRSFVVSVAKSSATFVTAAGSPLTVSSSPGEMVLGDFNGDTVLDLAVIVTSPAAAVRVFLGDGAGGFTATSAGPYPVGTAPRAIVRADFNGDGFQDLAIGNTDSADVTILLGDGAGGFSAAAGSPFSAGQGPAGAAGLVAGDFNQDGILDLALAGGSVTVLLGNGAGSFSAGPSSPLLVGTGASALAVADFNVDGRVDLAVVNSATSSVSTLFGDGAGGFGIASGISFPVGQSPISLAVGDFNRDGLPDLAVTAFGGSNVFVKLGDGFGRFTTGALIQGLALPRDLVVGDIDGDGIQDLIVAKHGSSGVVALPGNGSAGFPAIVSATSSGLNAISLAIGDLNGDGREDFIFANDANDGLTVLLGIAAGDTPQTITFGPLNNIFYDGTPSVLSVSASSGLLVTLASTTLDVCSTFNGVISVIAVGTCSITALQPGNATYAAATSVTRSFTASLAPQTITFGSLNDYVLGLSVGLSGTSSSGLPVTYTSTTPVTCTVSASTVTTLSLGTCTIVASQPGNAGFAAAPSVTRSFAVINASYNTGPVTCNSTSVNAVFVRAEGTKEQVADLTVNCVSGGSSTINLQVYLSPAVNVTSATVGIGGSAVNETVAGLQNTGLTSGVVHGVVSGGTVAFNGISAPPGAFAFTISNIRINASQAVSNAAPTSVSETIFISGTNVTPVVLPAANVAYVTKALVGINATATFANPVCSAVTAEIPSFNVQFGEGFANAFKVRGSATLNPTLGSQLTNNSETGYGVTSGGLDNTATSGTRIKIALNNIPSGVTLYVPVAAASNGGIITLTASETGPFSALTASAAPGAPVGTAALAGIGGSATAIYETTTGAPGGLETYSIPVYLVAAAGTIGAPSTITATVSFAPIGATDNVPNFVSGSSTTTVNGATFTPCGSTITFSPLSDVVFGLGTVTLSARASSGLPVSFASATPSVCTVAGNSATLKRGGSCSITASQSGSTYYAPAPDVTRTFTITPGPQSITFVVPADVPLGATPSIVATASSGLGISFSSTTPAICTASGNRLSTLSLGTCTVTASQSGNITYAAATPVTRSFTIVIGSQTITVDAIPDQILGGPPYQISARASSGLPVTTISVTPAVCDVTASLVLLRNSGICTLTASQGGNENLPGATSVSRTFTVNRAKPAGSFRPGPGNPVTVGTIPDAAATGDFNGDGKPDLAVANLGSSDVTILLGNGLGGFTAATGSPLPVGIDARAIAAHDFNGDGVPDLVVAGNSGAVTLLGDGAGGFAVSAQLDYNFGTSTTFLTVGDFDSDGIADIAVMNGLSDGSATRLNILLGVGNGTFINGVVGPFNNQYPAGLVVGDFDKDGRQDLAVALWSPGTGSSTVTILLGDGIGGFSAPAHAAYTGGTPITSIATGDFDGDGVQDLAVEDGSSASVTVLLGNGHSGFNPVSGSPFVSGLGGWMAVADFNGDGFTDLAIVFYDATIMLGDGSGHLVATGVLGILQGPPGQVAVGDFNRDGILDLAVPDSFPAITPGHSIVVRLGGLATTNALLSSTGPTTVTFGQTVTLSLAVTGPSAFPGFSGPAWAGFALPGGAVAFLDGATVLGNATQTGSPYSYLASGLAGGTHTFTANYNGDARTAASTSNTVTIQVNPASQTITFAALSNIPFTATPVTLTATASSGLGVSYASTTEAICTVAGNTVTLVNLGFCQITASQPGNANYSAAANIQQGFSVTQGSQTISFSTPGAITLSTTVTLTATATSGLTVAFASTTPGICTISDVTVTAIAPGSCSITASQLGNTTYAAAPPVTRTFAINPNPTVILAIGNSNGFAGETVEIPILLTSVGAPTLTTFQFDLNFTPEKLTFESVRLGAQLTASGKTISVNPQPNGDIRLLAAGLNQKVIANGTVAYATFTLGTPFSPSNITPTSCTSADAQAGTIVTACNAGTITLPPCDINVDGNANVADVQLIINEALSVSPATHDLNHDGSVNVADVQKVINAALGLGCSAN